MRESENQHSAVSLPRPRTSCPRKRESSPVAQRIAAAFTLAAITAFVIYAHGDDPQSQRAAARGATNERPPVESVPIVCDETTRKKSSLAEVQCDYRYAGRCVAQSAGAWCYYAERSAHCVCPLDCVGKLTEETILCSSGRYCTEGQPADHVCPEQQMFWEEFTFPYASGQPAGTAKANASAWCKSHVPRLPTRSGLVPKNAPRSVNEENWSSVIRTRCADQAG